MLTDFIAEWTKAGLTKELVHTPTRSCMAGVILTSPTGDTVRYVLQIMYTDSNNVAEYEAPLHGLHMVVSMGYNA